MLRFAEQSDRLVEVLDAIGNAINDGSIPLKKEEISEYNGQVERMKADFKRDKLIITFYGHYKTGKSSIAKCLTGIAEIKISAKIETAECHVYKWKENIDIADTPGLESGIREHDLKADAIISKSDLILYVIGPTGFTPQLFQHFKKFLENPKLRNRTMLVINKIDQEPNEDAINANMEVVKDQLGIPPAYVSAKYYLQGSQIDPVWVAKSGIPRLAEQIDRFCVENGNVLRLEKISYDAGELLDQMSNKLSVVNQPEISVALDLARSRLRELERARDYLVAQANKQATKIEQISFRTGIDAIRVYDENKNNKTKLEAGLQEVTKSMGTALENSFTNFDEETTTGMKEIFGRLGENNEKLLQLVTPTPTRGNAAAKSMLVLPPIVTASAKNLLAVGVDKTAEGVIGGLKQLGVKITSKTASSITESIGKIFIVGTIAIDVAFFAKTAYDQYKEMKTERENDEKEANAKTTLREGLRFAGEEAIRMLNEDLRKQEEKINHDCEEVRKNIYALQDNSKKNYAAVEKLRKIAALNNQISFSVGQNPQ